MAKKIKDEVALDAIVIKKQCLTYAIVSGILTCSDPSCNGDYHKARKIKNVKKTY